MCTRSVVPRLATVCGSDRRKYHVEPAGISQRVPMDFGRAGRGRNCRLSLTEERRTDAEKASACSSRRSVACYDLETAEDVIAPDIAKIAAFRAA